MSMDDGRVHYDFARPAQLRALAHAQEQHIHLAPGQQAQLQHEAWHAVQQKQGWVRANPQMRGVASNDDDQIEREADRMGWRPRAAARRTFTPLFWTSASKCATRMCAVIRDVFKDQSLLLWDSITGNSHRFGADKFREFFSRVLRASLRKMG